MKKIALAALIAAICTTAAQSADLPARTYTKAPIAPTSNWTGWYAGLNLGYGFTDPTVTTTPNDAIGAAVFGVIAPLQPSSFGMDGITGGAQIGYNWQTSANWLVGIEADIQGADLKGSTTTALPVFIAQPNAFFTAGQDVKWFGTLRGRLGWVANDRLVAYGTGGLAYGEVKDTATLGYVNPIANNAAIPPFQINCTVANNCYNGSSSKIQVGYTVGGGLEYAAWQNVTLKIEYLYVNLGSSNLTSVSNPGLFAPATINSHFSDLDFSVVRGGINYRF